MLVSDVLLYSDEISLRDRVFLSSGTYRADELDQVTSYYYKGYLPKGPWKRPTSDELDKLIAGNKPEQNYNSIYLSKIPDEILSLKNNLVISTSIPFLMCNSGYDRDHQDYIQFRNTLLSYFDRFLMTKKGLAILDLYGSPPGLKVTSANHETKTFVGLHVDEWDGLEWNKREYARNRICINLGSEERYFLFINLTALSILKAIQPFSQNSNSTPIDQFLNQFIDYPVTKVKLCPGEYYMAPTENIIHDGSTEGKYHNDLIFTMMGFFKAT